jgi:putative phosphoribosyl transferase
VIGLPRGGVPVAAPVARSFGAPLDVRVVRKIGAPGNPEYGLGAVVEGGRVWLDTPRVHRERLAPEDLAPTIAEELERAEGAWRIVVGVGAAPPEALAALTPFVDRIVAALVPPQFFAVGEFYEEFDPVPERAVIEELAGARERSGRAEKKRGKGLPTGSGLGG